MNAKFRAFAISTFGCSTYPRKIWTKFESQQFKDRFGSDSVIPIWFGVCSPGVLDESSRKGGMKFERNLQIDPQVSETVELLMRKLRDDRSVEATLDREKN